MKPHDPCASSHCKACSSGFRVRALSAPSTLRARRTTKPPGVVGPCPVSSQRAPRPTHHKTSR
eukprot:950527-Pelagomonas_calceolata.AAC.1